MLTSRFERQSGQAGGSPRPDSGHWSATHSDDGSADLDEELCLERQCRQLKALADNLNRVVTERNKEIEKLEKRLSETTPLFVSPLLMLRLPFLGFQSINIFTRVFHITAFFLVVLDYQR
uniref:PKcGMP_CC domain-containing protein n=1 Tax=Heterorhabditis bacteriophora TaxID=37862 RepID=A0A1I7X1T4_HETBA